ncbi:MAG TPA: hypothetical protein VGL83_00840 [Stellaceae bacterium]
MKHFARALVLILALAAWSPSTPPGVATLFSQSFQFTGSCTNTDMVYSWKIGGGPSEHQFIRPWLPFDITIRGVDLVTNTLPGMFWMVGNNADGDAMLFLGKNEYHGVVWFPSGTAFAFPGTADQEQSHYIDLHGACAKGNALLIMTLYYTRN